MSRQNVPILNLFILTKMCNRYGTDYPILPQLK